MRKLSDSRLKLLAVVVVTVLAFVLASLPHATADAVGGGTGATVKAGSTAAAAGDRSLVMAISPNSNTIQPGNTPNTSPWLVSINQGSNTAAVKAASTAPAATDPALVVALSPNGATNPVPQSSSTYAPLAYDLSATAATNIKASGGNVYGWFGNNPNASTCFLQFYNSASAVLGTSPLHPFGIPTGASWNIAPGGLALFNLSTAISTGQTTTATGSSACASAMTLTILYD